MHVGAAVGVHGHRIGRVPAGAVKKALTSGDDVVKGRVAYSRRVHFSELTPVEQRVLGCLIEKRWTTPDQYPLSLNALRLACNQSTNRDPVTDYDEHSVREAAERLSPAAPGPGPRSTGILPRRAWAWAASSSPSCASCSCAVRRLPASSRRGPSGWLPWPASATSCGCSTS
jgi:hypothetical protein